MLFNSYEFLFIFSPIAFGLFFILGKKLQKLAILWIFFASLFFYGWWDPFSLLIICASMLINYLIGYPLLKENISIPQVFRKYILSIGVIFNLALLGYYKYFHFFLNQWNFIFEKNNTTIPAHILPLGISFFTFVQIAFLVDAYKSYKKEKMFYSPAEYGFFVTYFPHLIAGPIIHHSDVIPLLKDKKTFIFQPQNFSVGLFLFAIGLFKKTVLADTIAEVVPSVFDKDISASLSFFECWLGAIAYTVQIYFDFSGYSDMALGLSKALNITLPANFFSPYKAVNIIDFWRRWHMSLSQFLRDYLYIPLGGNRNGSLRRYFNLFTTMVLGGLWHGAGWTFVLWGALHGIYLVTNHAWKTFFPWKIPKIAAQGITFLAVTIAWVFFRSPSISTAKNILLGMSGFQGISVSSKLLTIFPQLTTLPIKIAGNGFLPTLHTVPELLNFRNIGLYYLAFSLLIIFLLPNSIELLHKFQPALRVEKLSTEQKSYYSLLQWKPTTIWAIVCSLFLTFGILFINKNSVFLYFQF